MHLVRIELLGRGEQGDLGGRGRELLLVAPQAGHRRALPPDVDVGLGLAQQLAQPVLDLHVDGGGAVVLVRRPRELELEVDVGLGLAQQLARPVLALGVDGGGAVVLVRRLRELELEVDVGLEVAALGRKVPDAEQQRQRVRVVVRQRQLERLLRAAGRRALAPSRKRDLNMTLNTGEARPRISDDTSSLLEPPWTSTSPSSSMASRATPRGANGPDGASSTDGDNSDGDEVPP